MATAIHPNVVAHRIGAAARRAWPKVFGILAAIAATTLGQAHVSIETLLATPGYHPVTGRACTAHRVASPSRGVTWARKHHMDQDGDVFLT